MNNLGIFYINLARSQDRRRTIEAELNKYNFTYTRIEAADGKQPEMLKNSGYCAKLNKKYYHKELSSGEIGCVESHKRALSAFLQSDFQCALILEDDARANYDLFKELTSLAQTSNDWDVIKLYLGKKKKRLRNSVKISENLKIGIPTKVPTSALAQLVSREGAEKLLRAYKNFGEPADVLLKSWWRYNLHILAVENAVFDTADVESEIDAQSHRKGGKKNRLKRLWQKLKYEVFNQFNKQSDNLLSSLAKMSVQ